MLDAFPDEVEAALENGFCLLNRGMDRTVRRLKEVGDLVDVKKCIGVQDERNNDLTRCESKAVERRVPSVGEGIPVFAHQIRGSRSPDWLAVSPQSGQGACSKACL